MKDNGPRTYRFTVDYNTANAKGEMVYRQRLTGEYTRGLASGEVMWKNVTEADAAGATAPFAAAQKRDFMEGFRYRNDVLSTLKPDFFKGFPPTAVVERNLVWDTGMIEMFGQSYFDQFEAERTLPDPLQPGREHAGRGHFPQPRCRAGVDRAFAKKWTGLRRD